MPKMELCSEPFGRSKQSSPRNDYHGRYLRVESPLMVTAASYVAVKFSTTSHSELLARTALSQAEAGADVVSPRR